MDNIFSDIPDHLSDEVFQTIVETGSFRVERIISDGKLTPENEWCDQDENEWFILLRGGARLLLEDGSEPHVLKPGDYLNLPAHAKHRVVWTDTEEKTIWLALHYK